MQENKHAGGEGRKRRPARESIGNQCTRAMAGEVACLGTRGGEGDAVVVDNRWEEGKEEATEVCGGEKSILNRCE